MGDRKSTEIHVYFKECKTNVQLISKSLTEVRSREKSTKFLGSGSMDQPQTWSFWHLSWKESLTRLKNLIRVHELYSCWMRTSNSNKTCNTYHKQNPSVQSRQHQRDGLQSFQKKPASTHFPSFLPVQTW